MTIPTTPSPASTTSKIAREMTAAELDRAGLLHADDSVHISRFAVFIPADELGALRPIVIHRGAVIGAFAVVHGGTTLCEQARAEEHAVVGKPEHGYAVGQIYHGNGSATVIGPGVVIRCGAVVYADVRVGANTMIGHHSLLRSGVQVGSDTLLGHHLCVERAMMSQSLGMPSLPSAVTLPQRRALLARRIRWFVAATITYNVIEAIIALSEGARVSSTALIGFGLDSVIEVSSAAAVAWQFAGTDPEKREKVALRVIAFSFFALAAYVTVDSIRGLLGVGEAQHSPIGITLAAVSLAVMPVLSYAQRRAGRELGSASAVADSKQTLLCTYLSAVLLVGLLLNSLFGWSWADPIAALVIAGIAVKEGLNAWKGDTCCPSPAALGAKTPATDDDCACCDD